VTAALKLDLSARAFAAALAALAVVLAAAMWFMAISPRHSKASSLSQQISAEQAKIATAIREARQSHTAKTSTAQLKALEAALPGELAMPEIVDQLDSLARQAGVSLDTVTPQVPVVGVGYYAEPITVVVDGHFFDVKKFLHLVRTRVSISKANVHVKGRLYDISGVQLQQTEPAPTVTATLNMEAFYFSPTAAPAPVVPTSTTTTPAS
jgi:Tfp pilus assembly protein PilO